MKEQFTPYEPKKREMKKAEKLAPDAWELFHQRFDELGLHSVIEESFATLESRNEESVIEEGIKLMGEYGYELAGPVSIAHIPDNDLPESERTGHGVMMQKATFKRSIAS